MPLTLPPGAALLLDMDGTLIDIAPTPDSVVVPPGLIPTLNRLRDKLGGALALISGRPIAGLDFLLPGVATAVAGEHGAAIRLAPGAAVVRQGFPIPEAWRNAAEALVAAAPGTLVEQKPVGITLHFRARPEAGPAFLAFAERLAAEDPRFVVLPAKMAWELKPRGIDKGAALRTIMAAAPFAGRIPVFIGDDVTDTPAIEAARTLGGHGLFVPETFADPAGVRAWLAREAA